jgi:Na+/proline symporter
MTTSKQPFSEKFIGIALLSLAGPFIWVLHFAVLYGVQHIACATLKNNADFWVETSIIVITAVALLTLLLLIFKPDILQRLDRNQTRQETRKEFFSGIMRLLALLSFFGVLWSGIALFFLPTCGSVA